MGGGGDPPVFLRSHVPKKRFFDEMDQENSEKQEGKNAWMFPVLVCSPLVGNALMIPPSCDPHSYGTPPPPPTT